MKPKYDRSKVMKDIIFSRTNKYLEEEYLNTTLTQPAISKMRTEYMDHIRDKAQHRQLVEIAARIWHRIETFKQKYGIGETK